MSEARRLLERLMKATQPMDFCHVCQSVHSNFKDASNHKEWCAWAKADAYLAQPSREGELVAALEEIRDCPWTSFAFVNEIRRIARTAIEEEVHPE